MVTIFLFKKGRGMFKKGIIYGISTNEILTR